MPANPPSSAAVTTIGEAPLVSSRVVNVERLAAGTVRLTLEAADGGAVLPAWTPGSHIDVVLPDGRVRQYSLCGAAASGQYQVAILDDELGRGGSRWLCQNVGAGDTLEISAPRNNFELVDADSYRFVAGGIGITPFVPMVEELVRRGRPWAMVYGGRSRDTMPFADRLAGLGSDVHLVPQDELGLIDVAAAVGRPSPGAVVYCCGPEGLIQAVQAAHEAQGWERGTLHVERFSPKEAEYLPDRPFRVVAAMSGVEVDVASDESIVSALQRVGITVPTSCTEGTCGTCECILLDGLVEHRDSFMSDEEHAAAEGIAVCVSRSLDGNPLTLDV